MWPIILSLLKYGSNYYKRGLEKKEANAVGKQVINSTNGQQGTVAQGTSSPVYGTTKNKPTSDTDIVTDPNAVKEKFDAGISYKPEPQYDFSVNALNNSSNNTANNAQGSGGKGGFFGKLGDALTANDLNAIDNELGGSLGAMVGQETNLANPSDNWQNKIGEMLNGQSANVIPTMNSTSTFNPLQTNSAMYSSGSLNGSDPLWWLNGSKKGM